MQRNKETMGMKKGKRRREMHGEEYCDHWCIAPFMYQKKFLAINFYFALSIVRKNRHQTLITESNNAWLVIFSEGHFIAYKMFWLCSHTDTLLINSFRSELSAWKCEWHIRNIRSSINWQIAIKYPWIQSCLSYRLQEDGIKWSFSFWSTSRNWVGPEYHQVSTNRTSN